MAMRGYAAGSLAHAYILGDRLDRAHAVPQGPAREALYHQVEDILLRDSHVFQQLPRRMRRAIRLCAA